MSRPLLTKSIKNAAIYTENSKLLSTSVGLGLGLFG